MVQQSNNTKAVATVKKHLNNREQIIWIINHPPSTLFEKPECLDHYFSQDYKEARRRRVGNQTVEVPGQYQAVQVDIIRISLNSSREKRMTQLPHSSMSLINYAHDVQNKMRLERPCLILTRDRKYYSEELLQASRAWLQVIMKFERMYVEFIRAATMHPEGELTKAFQQRLTELEIMPVYIAFFSLQRLCQKNEN